MRWAIAVLAIIVVVTVVKLAAARSMRALFRAEVQAALARHRPDAVPLISEADLAPLPPPVASFLRKSGFVGRPRATNARIVWKELLLKTAHDRPWMRVECEQLNVAPRPARIVLMRGRVAGVVPFEGRDKYQDGHGHMLVRAAKVITVADARGPEMDRSALVTVLAEVLMLPSLALGEHVRWEVVDGRTARATLTDGVLSVSGTFHFDEASNMVRFDTEDRWQDGTPPRRIPWSAAIGGYVDRGGVRTPTTVAATWREAEGDFTYARGVIERIDYDVRAFE